MKKLLCLTLLLLHQGDALISGTTVKVGEPWTFTCLLPDVEYSNTQVKWYKQRVGDTLMLITTLFKGTTNPKYEQKFPSTRFRANFTETTSTLTILKTILEDEAIYHCAFTTWSDDHWSGRYLSLTGNLQKKDLFIVQSPTACYPVDPGASMTLQCSVVSDPKNTSRDGDKVGSSGTGLRSKEFSIILFLLFAVLGVSISAMILLIYNMKTPCCCRDDKEK